MTTDSNVPAPTAAEAERDDVDGDELIEDELVIEEVSIDGMCGVY